MYPTNNMTVVNWLSIVLSFHLIVNGIQQVGRIPDKAPNPTWLYLYLQGDLVYDALSFTPLFIGVLMLLSMKASKTIFRTSLAISTVYLAIMGVLGILAGYSYTHGILSFLTLSIVSLIAWVSVRQEERDRKLYDDKYCDKSFRERWVGFFANLR